MEKNRKSKFIRNYLPLLICVLVGTILNFLPVLMGKSLKNPNGDFPFHLLHLSSSSGTLYCSIVASIISCQPIIFDYILDLIYRVPKPSYDSFIPKRETFCALVTIDFVILLYILPTHNYDILPGLIGTRDTFFNFAFLFYLHDLEPKVWDGRLICFIGILFLTGNILESFYIFNPVYYSFAAYAMIALVSTAYISLIYLYYQWYKFVYTIKDPLIKRHMNFCNLHTVYFGFFAVADWFPIFIPALHRDPLWSLFVGNTYLTLYYYLLAVCTVMLAVVTTRLAKMETSETKKLFIRYISHEMRTPLNTINMGLKLLKRELDDGDLENMYQSINEMTLSTDVAVNVLNDMLTYDRLQTDPLKLHLEHFCPLPIILSAMGSMLIHAREAGVDLSDQSTFVTKGSLCRYTIHADSRKLAQVMRNILSNAITYTPRDGSVKVYIEPYHEYNVVQELSESHHVMTTIRRVSALQRRHSPAGLGLSKQSSDYEEKPYDRLRIRIVDNGSGISKEKQVKLFEEVLQFTPGTLDGGGGPGFGLFITKRIVEAHGWRLSIYSEGQGLGTTTTLIIPIAKTLEPDSPNIFKAQSFKSIAEKSAAIHTSIRLSNVDNVPITPVITPSPRTGSCEVKGEDASFERAKKIGSSVHYFKKSEGRSSHSSVMKLIEATSYDIDEELPKGNSVDGNCLQPGRLTSKSHTVEDTKTNKDVDEYSNTLMGSIRRMVSAGSGSALTTDEEEGPGLFDPPKKEDVKSGPKRKPSLKRLLSSNSRRRLFAAFSPVTSSPIVPSTKTMNEMIFYAELTVLIVDDSTINRKMMGRMFAKRYGTIAEAMDGVEAVEMVKAQLSEGKSYSVILMDYQMPRMDGPSATKRIREMGYKGPIIGVTGNALPPDIKTFLDHGADHVFLKPLDLDAFDAFMAEYGKIK